MELHREKLNSQKRKLPFLMHWFHTTKLPLMYMLQNFSTNPLHEHAKHFN